MCPHLDLLTLSGFPDGIGVGLLRGARGDAYHHRHALPPHSGGRDILFSTCTPTDDRRGAAGTRTPDLRRARAALSQLSYGPLPEAGHGPTADGGRAWTRTRDLGLIRAAL